MTKFNANNTNYIEGKYPLFLGQEMGLGDTVNVTYPQLEDLYQKQLSYMWSEFEVDITQDRMDMQRLPSGTIYPMVQNIMWQALADAVASRSISSLLMKHVSNPELENLISIWAFFEVIHNRTYSHIIKQTFENPVEMIAETYANSEVLMRSEAIVNAFDALEALADDADMETKRRAIIKTLVALFALEAIAFMSSFAVTFAITETGVFQGIGQLVTLICRDEVLHTRMGFEIFSILKAMPEWAASMQAIKGDIKEILDCVTNQELQWPDHIFKESSIVGLNATILKEFVLYQAYPVYLLFDAQFDFEVITKQPLAYMDNYIDTSKVQVAAQELQLSSYQVGAIVDDTADMDLDLDFDF